MPQLPRLPGGGFLPLSPGAPHHRSRVRCARIPGRDAGGRRGALVLQTVTSARNAKSSQG